MGACIVFRSTNWEVEIWSNKNLERDKSCSTRSRIRFNELEVRTGIWSFDSISIQDLKNIDWEHEPASIGEPLLLDNNFYRIRFKFHWGTGKDSYRVFQGNKNLDETFFTLPSVSGQPQYIQGSLNTGNDLGWIELRVEYPTISGLRIDSLSLEIVSSKLDFHKDLGRLEAEVEKDYPLWTMSFQRQTQRGAEKVFGDRLDLFWLMLLQSRAEGFLSAVKTVMNNPHSRLLPKARYIKALNIKRIRTTLEESVIRGLVEKPGKAYRVETQRLSLDTPENRFIKYALNHVSTKLRRLLPKMKGTNRVSPLVLSMWQNWHDILIKRESSPTFNLVGKFTGLKNESLVLHHRNGYSSAYRCWLDLRKALKLSDSAERISTKNIAELYEVWCFLEIRRLLESILGSEALKPVRKAQLKMNGLELQLENGFGAAFQFETSDLKVLIAHEPVFKRKPNSLNVLSFTVNQKPDIFLYIEYPDGQRLTWLFDAKYRIRPRIEERQYEGEAEDEELLMDDKFQRVDLVPDDAINQMHRYRDALIFHSGEKISREAIGAFALYPGKFDQSMPENANPYYDWIQNVNIGAFPLLPYSVNGGEQNQWLRNHLELLIRRPPTYHIFSPSAKIPPKGLSFNFDYSDMVLIAPIGPDRIDEYSASMRQGTATSYHFPANFIGKEMVSRLAYLGITINGFLYGVYKLIAPELVLRKDLTEIQTGTRNFSNPTSKYWLVQLMEYHPLKIPIRIGTENTWFHYVLRHQLFDQSLTWKDIRKVEFSAGPKGFLPKFRA